MSWSGGNSSNSSTSTRSHVHLQVDGTSAGLSTQGAVERLTAMYLSDATIQMASLWKTAVTLIASILDRSSTSSSSTHIRFDWYSWMLRLHMTCQSTTILVCTLAVCTLKIDHRDQFPCLDSKGSLGCDLTRPAYTSFYCYPR